MNENHIKTTTQSSLILLILKELRLEKNMHQAHLAEACDKTPSAWTKIELGQNPLTMEIFFRVCNALQVPASSVLATAERHSALLSQNSWGIMSKQLDFDEDNLLKCIKQYYESQEYKNRTRQYYFNIILTQPVYNLDGDIQISPVFSYILNNCDQNNKLQSR